MPVQSLSLSWRLPLFVSPKGTVYAPYPSLLCAHLLRFQSIPPQCLLSPSIVPINYSAQSLPPTGGVSPPPLEMNDWQVCSVSNIHSDNRREGKWLGFSQRENCRRQRRVRKSGGQRERTLYIISWHTFEVATVSLSPHQLNVSSVCHPEVPSTDILFSKSPSPSLCLFLYAPVNICALLLGLSSLF